MPSACRRTRRLPARQGLDRRPVAADQGFLLGAGPALELAFDGDGVLGVFETLGPDQLDRAAAVGPGVGEAAGVVVGDAVGDVLAAVGADGVGAVGAAEPLDEDRHGSGGWGTPRPSTSSG